MQAKDFFGIKLYKHTTAVKDVFSMKELSLDSFWGLFADVSVWNTQLCQVKTILKKLQPETQLF